MEPIISFFYALAIFLFLGFCQTLFGLNGDQPLLGICLPNILRHLVSLNPTTFATMTPLLDNVWLLAFVAAFIFRYTRLLINIVGYLKHTSMPIPEHPTVTPQHVTVIIPTVDPTSIELMETIESILKAEPAQILVVTAGSDLKSAHAAGLCRRYPILATHIAKPNKRNQVCKALPQVRMSDEYAT